MSKIENGYKVVRIGFYGGYYSHCRGDGEIQYKINEWVRPIKKRGPIAVFSNKEDATMFLKGYGVRDSVLCTCKYVPSKRKSVWCFDNSYKSATPLRELPEGTVLADRVMITEEILRRKTK
jgi:hypothetical protein